MGYLVIPSVLYVDIMVCDWPVVVMGYFVDGEGIYAYFVWLCVVVGWLVSKSSTLRDT